jgi:poly(glycerol-phosphate) alpha-glucosyltransferase
LPSLREGHPLILFEAWAHQLPIIATRVGSIPKFVNQTNGYLISPKDPTALIRAMKLAIKNQYLKIFGQNGYQLVKKDYSWDKTVKKYYQAFQTLLRQ